MTLHKYFCMAPVLSHHCPTPYSSTAFRLALPASTSRHYNLHFLHSVEPISFICTPSLLSSFCRGVGGYDGSGHRAFSSSLSIISSFTWTCIPFKKKYDHGGLPSLQKSALAPQHCVFYLAEIFIATFWPWLNAVIWEQNKKIPECCQKRRTRHSGVWHSPSMVEAGSIKPSSCQTRKLFKRHDRGGQL